MPRDGAAPPLRRRRRRSSRRDESPSERGPRADAELRVDAGEMALDGALAQEELGGHLPVRSSCRDQRSDAPPRSPERQQRLSAAERVTYVVEANSSLLEHRNRLGGLATRGGDQAPAT